METNNNRDKVPFFGKEGNEMRDGEKGGIPSINLKTNYKSNKINFLKYYGRTKSEISEMLICDLLDVKTEHVRWLIDTLNTCRRVRPAFTVEQISTNEDIPSQMRVLLLILHSYSSDQDKYHMIKTYMKYILNEKEQINAPDGEQEHAVCVFIWKTGVDDAPVWHLETYIDDRLCEYSGPTIKIIKSMLRQKLLPCFGNVQIHTFNNYIEYKQALTNKLMHTINGNITMEEHESNRAAWRKRVAERYIFRRHMKQSYSETVAQIPATTSLPVAQLTTTGGTDAQTVNINLNISPGSTVTLNFTGQMTAPVAGLASGSLDVGVNGETYIGGITSSDDASNDEGWLSGSIKFISQAVNTLDILWTDITSIGSFFSGIFTTAPESAGMVPLEAVVVTIDYDICKTAELVASTLNPRPLPVSNYISVLKSDLTWLKQRNFNVIFRCFCSYELWVQRHNNRVQHALTGNTSDQYESTLPTENPYIIPVMDTDYDAGTSPELLHFMKTYSVEKKVKTDLPEVSLTIPQQQVVSDVILNDKLHLCEEYDMYEQVLAVLSHLSNDITTPFTSYTAGIVSILTFYEHDLDYSRVSGLTQRLLSLKQQSATREEDETICTDDRLRTIHSAKLSAAKNRPHRPPVPEQKRRSPAVDKAENEDIPVDYDKWIATPEAQALKATMVQKARINFTAAKNRLVAKYQANLEDFVYWMVNSKCSTKYKKMIIDDVLGHDDVKNLNHTTPPYLVAYCLVYGVEFYVLPFYLLDKMKPADKLPYSYDLSFVNWLTFETKTQDSLDGYMTYLKKHHNKLVHALNGNSLQEEIDKSITFDELKKLMAENKPVCHLDGYMKARFLGNTPMSANRSVADHQASDIALVMVQHPDRSTTEKVAMRIPLTGYIPRHVRTAGGAQVSSGLRLPMSAIQVLDPPDYTMPVTDNGYKLLAFMDKNNQMVGRQDNCTWAGWNTFSLLSFLSEPPVVSFCPDQCVLKLMLLLHCLQTPGTCAGLHAADFSFYDTYTSPVAPIKASFSSYGYNTSTIFGENNGGAAARFPITTQGLPGGRVSFHMSTFGVQSISRISAVYIPAAFINNAGQSASINIILFIIMWVAWPIGFFSNLLNTSDDTGGQVAASRFINLASTVHIPGIDPLQVIMPRQGSRPDPTTAAEANGMTMRRPSTGPVASATLAANTELVMSVPGAQTEYPISELLYTWLAGGTITQYHVTNFLAILSQFVDISASSEAMADVLSYHCFRSGLTVMAPHGNLTPDSAFPAQSGVMQTQRMLDGRQPEYSVQDWPMPSPPHQYQSWICNSDVIAWNHVATKLRFPFAKPGPVRTMYKYMGDIRAYTDLKFNAMMMMLTFQTNYHVLGASQLVWTGSMNGDDTLPRSLKSYVSGFYKSIAVADCGGVVINVMGSYLQRLCAVLFNSAPRVVVYGPATRPVGFFHRLITTSNSEFWGTTYRVIADTFYSVPPPTLVSEFWLEVFGRNLPLCMRARPISANLSGYRGYYKGMRFQSSDGFWSGYVDENFLKVFGATESEWHRFSDANAWNNRLLWWDGISGYNHNGHDLQIPFIPGIYPTQRREGLYWLTTLIPNVSQPTSTDPLQSSTAVPKIDPYGVYIWYYMTSQAASNLYRKYHAGSAFLAGTQCIMTPDAQPSEDSSMPSAEISGTDNDLREYDKGVLSPVAGIIEPLKVPAAPQDAAEDKIV
jgi:hypothetical protein